MYNECNYGTHHHCGLNCVIKHLDIRCMGQTGGGNLLVTCGRLLGTSFMYNNAYFGHLLWGHLLCTIVHTWLPVAGMHYLHINNATGYLPQRKSDNLTAVSVMIHQLLCQNTAFTFLSWKLCPGGEEGSWR